MGADIISIYIPNIKSVLKLNTLLERCRRNPFEGHLYGYDFTVTIEFQLVDARNPCIAVIANILCARYSRQSCICWSVAANGE